ncbi:hypothetical protein BN1088_1430030 [Sphingobacterium sp. PM2-P1-29]|nr:hypothetical protein BN1088_1430030 [Sphingobacterium sp. PM2-P1-29]
MANKPLSMQKIRQLLLFMERGFSQRSIEKETGINRRTIAGYLKRFAESGLSTQELLLFDDRELYPHLNANNKEQNKDPRQFHRLDRLLNDRTSTKLIMHKIVGTHQYENPSNLNSPFLPQKYMH